MQIRINEMKMYFSPKKLVQHEYLRDKSVLLPPGEA